MLGALCLLLVVAYLLLRQAYPPARLQAMLAEQVSAATGRAFRVDGELSIRLLPNIAIEATDIALANADWSENGDMLRAHRVAFLISLRDLLHGWIHVASVDLQGAQLQLESDGAGRVNWRFESRQGPSTRAPLQLELDELTAADVRVAFQDRRTGGAHAIDFETVSLTQQGEYSRLDALLALGAIHWKIEGRTGPAVQLLHGNDDWPFDLRATSAGASITAQGTTGLRVRAGNFDAKVALRLDSPAALADFGAAVTRLPMPLEASATLARSREQLRLDELRLSVGGQVLRGSATLDTHAPPMRLDAQLAAASIDLAPWLTDSGKARAAAGARQPLFGNSPLPWPTLPPFPVTLALRVDRLLVPNLPAITGVDSRWTIEPQRLRIDPVAFGMAGGQARGRLDLALRPGVAPRAEIQLDASGMGVEALDAARGAPRRVNSGRAALALRLTLAGSTPASLAASANGEAMLSVRDMRLAGRSAALDRDIVARLFEALLPRSTPRENLLVQCAVARLPLRQGVAAIDRSIAMETQQIAVTASGVIDLTKQNVSLAFQPRVKRGLNLNPGSLVELLLLSGPLEDPQLSLNPSGAVRQAAAVGLAAATGGATLLLPALRSEASAVSACDQAARGAPAPAAGTSRSSPAASAVGGAASAASSASRALLRPFR